MTPASTVPGLLRELGEKGTQGLRHRQQRRPGRLGDSARAENDAWRTTLLRTAGPHLMRSSSWPNCIGYAVPPIGLNASFGPTRIKSGRLAAIAQSGAVLAAPGRLEGSAQGIGFSHLVSMGDMADVDFGDLLDMLAQDWETRAVLMYVERASRKRASSCRRRAVWRASKPVIVLKAGRHAAASAGSGFAHRRDGGLARGL